ncbi:MAG: sulfurtransferase [Desulfuromusa sp.]|nr:sulfurtransferase [Desulfuromusa sp.]
MKLFRGMLFAILLLVFSSLSYASPLVSVDWLKQNQDSVVLLDVQNKPVAYGKGHIPGALQVIRHQDLEDYTVYPPNKYPNKEQFEAVMSKLGITNKSTIVAYDDHHGIFASRLFFIMELYGHDVDKLKVLDGGIVAWGAAGNKTSTQTTSANKSNYNASDRKPNVVVTWSDVFRNVLQLKDKNIVLLDARPNKEFIGEKERTIRSGHIPRAINVTGQSAINLNKEQTYKSAAEIRDAFSSAGITTDKTVYVYCHSSDRSAHAYVAMKYLAGYSDVRIYDGAWLEWANLTALPMGK